MLGVERRNHAEYLDLLIADSVAMHASGGLHGQKSYDLEHVVLDHVADRPSVIVEFPPPLDPEFFCHCDLDTLDVIPIPDRLQEAVGEAKKQKSAGAILSPYFPVAHPSLRSGMNFS